MKFKYLLIALCFFDQYCNAQQKDILLDNYYNNEVNLQTGKPYHYLWEDENPSGFSEFGKLFRKEGYTLSLLKSKPTNQNLRDAKVYIIVDPDTENEVKRPNFMDEKTASVIASWVKKGGRLLILANDANNCDLDSLNLLAGKFDLKFNKNTLYTESPKPGEYRNFESCSFVNLPNHDLFKQVDKIFIKGLSSISCKNNSKPILTDKNHTIIAEVTYGKGKVIAVGDPWLYNEYINHYSLPIDFNNLQAAKNLVKILTQ